MNDLLPILGLGVAAIVGLVAFAAVVKMREVRAAQNWHQTRGKITRSEVRARKKRDIDNREKTVSEPRVAYDYTVNGKHFNAERISLAEIIAESEIEPVLQRYPVGAEVTVYYNPANPGEAVLERALPADFGKGLGGVFLFLGGGGVLALLTVAKVPELIAPYLPNPQNALFVTLAAGLGVFLLLFGLALQRQAIAMQTWASVPGTVLSAEIRSYTHWKEGRQRTLYTPGITYQFSVRGHQYTSDRYSLGAESGWSSPHFAEGKVQQHPPGSAVTVYYNPNAPAESVLDRRISGGWLIWALALALLALAAFSAGLF